jgi:simple sugar transport system ATP-binding protein
MQPTRGLDVGAIEGVQRLLLDLRRSGTAVLLVSEELDEIVCLSDRVAVIYEGQIVGEIPGDSCDSERNRIGLMMTGQYKEGSAASAESPGLPGQGESEEGQRGGA